MLPRTESIPFLYNPSVITDFFSFATSASVTPSDTNSNIQDFTKQAHHHEPKKLQAGKQEDNISADNGNEVVPSIIQKKISAILRKIQYYTQFSNNANSGNDAEMNDFDDFFKDNDNDDENKEEKEQGQVTEGNIDDEDDKNGEVEDITVSAANSITESRIPITEHTALTPSSIAVFFMELVGTVMGLLYGATAQIGNSKQS